MTKENLLNELELLNKLLAEALATRQFLLFKHRETILQLNALVDSCTQCNGEGCTYCK